MTQPAKYTSIAIFTTFPLPKRSARPPTANGAAITQMYCSEAVGPIGIRLGRTPGLYQPAVPVYLQSEHLEIAWSHRWLPVQPTAFSSGFDGTGLLIGCQHRHSQNDAIKYILKPIRQSHKAQALEACTQQNQ